MSRSCHTPLLNRPLGLVQNVERVVTELRKRLRKGSSRTDRFITLYPRRVPAKITHISTSDAPRKPVNPDLQGRRIGFSFRGEKLHVIREVSYSPDRFLCGAKKSGDKPLRVVTGYTDVSNLCRTCSKLVKEGVY